MSVRMGLLHPLEHSIYRLLFHVRGEQPWDDRVTVIEIDEASLATIGPFPWPRHYYTELLKKLAPADANVIAFDILFADSTDDDAELAMAMARHGNVVLATAWDEQRGVIGPNAKVVTGAIATGHIHNHADGDGITRVYHAKVNGTLALSVAAVQHYNQPQAQPKLDAHNAPSLWLNWRGFAQNAPRYSFVDVLTGQVPASEFTNKIVFIGFTGEGLDVMTTPYNQNPPAAGVYQHIVAANNLLAQNHLKPIALPIWVMLIFLSPLWGYGLANRCYGVYLLANSIVIFVWAGVVIVAFYYSYWLPAVIPVVAMTATSCFMRLAEYLQGRGHCLRKSNSGIQGIYPDSAYRAAVE